MSEMTPSQLLNKVRTGDAGAAAELVRRYEPHIRLEVRLRLRDPRLRRLFDSMDVCQSVLASFFLRVAAGEADLERPEQLPNYLIAMTRNKLAARIRHERAARRDHRQVVPEEARVLQSVAGREQDAPSRVSAEELWREFRARLNEDELQLADRRAQGQSWATISSEMGGTPEARRKQLTRAVDRIMRELGLEETLN